MGCFIVVVKSYQLEAVVWLFALDSVYSLRKAQFADECNV